MAISGIDLLWGCPHMNFKANPPFNEMRQGFAIFKKEARMAQYLPELFLRSYVMRGRNSTFINSSVLGRASLLCSHFKTCIKNLEIIFFKSGRSYVIDRIP